MKMTLHYVYSLFFVGAVSIAYWDQAHLFSTVVFNDNLNYHFVDQSMAIR